MKKHEHIVKSLMPGGIGEELGIEPGDKLLAINGNEIQDVFDYYYYEESEQLLLLIEKPDGEEWELEIEKDEDESLGIEFDQSLMDEYRSCRNKCMFCFIDQMPKGMRETLYFKDDDSRLSFLQGNYITLTNMSDHDVERIVKYRLEPINISFQTTNPELRCKMLHNRFAGEALKKVDILYRGQIEMNGQIVLCKGVNDGEELERTIRDLTGYLPYLEDAREVLSVIHRWQEKIYQEHGIHMIHAGDEWYVLAEEEVPEEERYDGYLQLENGVGMMRLLFNEVQEALSAVTGDGRQREISLATGRLMYPYIGKILEEIRKKFPNITTHLYAIRNDFFGERITVSGLITGQDLTGQLKGQPLGERLLLPCNMLKIGEPVFLDDFTLEEVENSLQVKTDIVKSSGQDLLDAVIGVYENDDFSTDRRRGRFQEM